MKMNCLSGGVLAVMAGAGIFMLGMTAMTAQAGDPIRVLILSGQNNHNWKATTPALQQVLVRGGFTVDVTDHPEQMTSQMLSKYDVLLSNWNSFGKKDSINLWPEAARTAFLEFVRGGKGVVVIHAGGSSFYDWPDYQKIVGASWKNGQTAHHAPHAFTVKPSAIQHPVTSGMAPFTQKDELWLKPGIHPDAVVLATGDDQPVVLATSFGKGRGFTTLMGHDATFIASPGFQKLLLRGVEWAATGR